MPWPCALNLLPSGIKGVHCTAHTVPSRSFLRHQAWLKVRTARPKDVSLRRVTLTVALLDDAPSWVPWGGGDPWDVGFQG